MTIRNAGNIPRYEAEVALSCCFADPSYQRGINRDMERTIHADFDWWQINVLILSHRKDGRYAIIDGQTRAAAARKLDILALPALIHDDLSRQQEALLFADFQLARRNIHAIDNFKAQRFGRRTWAMEIGSVLDELGLKLRKQQRSPESLSAVAALEFMWVAGGVPHVRGVLNAIMEAWPGITRRFGGDIMRSISVFVIKDNPDWGLLIRVLSEMRDGPLGLVARAAQLQMSQSNAITPAGKNPKYGAEILRVDYKALTHRLAPRAASDAAASA